MLTRAHCNIMSSYKDEQVGNMMVPLSLYTNLSKFFMPSVPALGPPAPSRPRELLRIPNVSPSPQPALLPPADGILGSAPFSSNHPMTAPPVYSQVQCPSFSPDSPPLLLMRCVVQSISTSVDCFRACSDKEFVIPSPGSLDLLTASCGSVLLSVETTEPSSIADCRCSSGV
jgi:hypothetical protein